MDGEVMGKDYFGHLMDPHLQDKETTLFSGACKHWVSV